MQIKEIEIGLNKGLYGNAHKSPAVEIRFLLTEIATLTNERGALMNGATLSCREKENLAVENNKGGVAAMIAIPEPRTGAGSEK